MDRAELPGIQSLERTAKLISDLAFAPILRLGEPHGSG